MKEKKQSAKKYLKAANEENWRRQWRHQPLKTASGESEKNGGVSKKNNRKHRRMSI
jgi:hypothetical protein